MLMITVIMIIINNTKTNGLIIIYNLMDCRYVGGLGYLAGVGLGRLGRYFPGVW